MRELTPETKTQLLIVLSFKWSFNLLCGGNMAVSECIEGVSSAYSSELVYVI